MSAARKERIDFYVEPPQYWPELTAQQRIIRVRIIETILISKVERARVAEAVEAVRARIKELPHHLARMNVERVALARLNNLLEKQGDTGHL